MSQPSLSGFPAVPVQPALSEKELQAAVIDCARTFGWLVAHFRSVPVKRGNTVRWETPVQADGKGFPDLVIVRERVLWVELKVGGNQLSHDQERWGKALTFAGAEWHLWTDKDWHAGVIDGELRERRAA